MPIQRKSTFRSYKSNHPKNFCNNIKQLIPIFIFSLGLISCSKPNNSTPILPEITAAFLKYLKSFSPSTITSPISVMDELGAPIANAKVMIGSQQNNPFENNIFITDNNGNIQIPPKTMAQWKTPLPITAWAAGRVPVTYFQQDPPNQTNEISSSTTTLTFDTNSNTYSSSSASSFSSSLSSSAPSSLSSLTPSSIVLNSPIQFYLKSSLNRQLFELKGQGTSGFDIKDKDDWVDFALMFEAISKQSLLNFDLSLIISPQSDVVEVAGQTIHLPSNVSVPKQRESYFLPITLEKPIYRSYFYTPGSKMFFALKGRFPFKTVVNEMRGDKPFHELINHFNFQSGTLRNLAISTPNQKLDLPVNELKFIESRSFKAPVFDSKEYMIAIAGNMYDHSFIPTDIKTVLSNQNTKLVTAAGSDPVLLTVIQRKDHPKVVDRVSSAITPLNKVLVNNAPVNPTQSDDFISDNFTSDEFMSDNMNDANNENALADLAQPTMISLMPNPVVVANAVKIKLPALPKSLKTTGTYAVLSDVKVKKSGEFNAEVADPRWEIYAPDWISEFELPTLPANFQNLNPFDMQAVIPGDVQVKQQLRWDVTVLAKTETVNNINNKINKPMDAYNSSHLNNSLDTNNIPKKIVDLGPRLFNDSTHAARSSQTFQPQ